MDIIKQNAISITFGVIAILAVVACFIPLGGMEDTVQQELDKRAKTHQAIAAQISKPRQLPATNPDNPTQENLPYFPSESIIEQGSKIKEKLTKQSEVMRDAAVAVNKHAVLEPGALPTPPSDSARYNFRNKYNLLFTVAPGQQLPPLAAQMKAGAPPTGEQVKARQDEIARQISKEKLYVYNGQATNQPAVDAEIKQVTALVPDQMRSDVAKNSTVYANPDVFGRWPGIPATGGAMPDPGNMYMAQVWLWIQQDIMKTVTDINKGTAGPTAAPLKRLIRCDIPQWFLISPTVPTNGDADAAVGKDLNYTSTGRVSNPLYDVMLVTLEADVEAARLPDFLRELSRNRLINPIHVNVKTIDNAVMLGQGFLYGNEPVVNVTIDCEALFLRQWTLPLMPAAVKTRLQIPLEGAAPPAEGQQPATPTAAAGG